MSEVKSPKELKPVIANISTTFQEHTKVDLATGVGTIDESFLEKTLPDDLPIQYVKKVDDWRSNLAVGVTHGAGVLSNDAFIKDPALPATSFNVPMGHKNSLHVAIKQNGTELDITGIYKDVAGANNSQMKIARELINEMWTSGTKNT